ncbi:hypothetical protein VIGAN_08304300, partial [Vigna angularis var. angularis]
MLTTARLKCPHCIMPTLLLIAIVIVAVSLTTPLFLVQSLRRRREKNYGFGVRFVAERYFVLEILFRNISHILR